MAIRIEIESETAVSKRPARALVYENDQLVAEVIAEVDLKQGADDGYYHCVTLKKILRNGGGVNVFDQARREKRIVEAILYFASDEGKEYLPSIPRVVLFEFIAAVAEYLSGETRTKSYLECMEYGGEERIYQTNKAMAEIFEKFGEKLPDAIRVPIQELVALRFVYDHGEKWHENSFANWFQTITERPITHSTFSLSAATIEHIKTNAIPCFDAETINHLKTIADCMKKYIEKDLECIREHFGW